MEVDDSLKFHKLGFYNSYFVKKIRLGLGRNLVINSYLFCGIVRPSKLSYL